VAESDQVSKDDFVAGLALEGQIYAPLGQLLEEYDALICPTFAVAALPAEYDPGQPVTVNGQVSEDWMDVMMTLPFNIASRCPVISVPSGLSRDGVPTGLSVVGRTYDDVTAFRIAAAHEERMPWLDAPERRPGPVSLQVPQETAVTLANWQEPPFNRWAFQHVSELIPVARISRGTGPPWKLPYRRRDLTGLQFRAGGRDMTVGELLAETYTDGFLVLQRGRIVAEEYFNGMTPGTRHLLMSVSKSVTAAVAGILAGQGVLDLSAPLTGVLPELAGTSFDEATAQHLLDMRAGTRFGEDYEDPGADVRVYEQVYLWRPRDGRPLPADATAYFATLGNDGAHGGPFRYRSILTDVLAWALERASGQRLHELIARWLWQPMGAESDAEITVDGRGNPMADGGMCATLRDLGRFGRLPAGRPDGRAPGLGPGHGPGRPGRPGCLRPG
jgi:CubicO group peptidase (beta-lactamase class C family)